MDCTRRHLAGLAAGALVLPGCLARAQSAAGLSVVELFTSQGCSSCPPADALMVELTREPGTVPITYPVEIWDYLGWRDTLANPAFTARQRAYAALVARKRIYTPQAVINGSADCVGSDLTAIDKLKRVTAAPSDRRIAVAAGGEGWRAVAPEGAGNARFVLVPFVSRISVPIGRGENSGRTITYANVARSLIDLGPAADQRAVTISRAELAAFKADGFALLVQRGTLAQPEGIVAGALVDSGGIRA